ncbi:MAG TPA: hypothetical protein VHM02_08465 [Thermoanaerobaculia bacterium]|nr:hypothetical protein [Thermoanaerobaculia bacterium]
MHRCARGALLLSLLAVVPAVASAQVRDPELCTGTRTVRARVVALDQVLWMNRNGASIPGGMIYALASDVFPDSVTDPREESWENSCAVADCSPGEVHLGSYRRPRPLVLRANEGDCVEIEFTNLLAPEAVERDFCSGDTSRLCSTNSDCAPSFGECSGYCADGTTACQNDADCGSGNTPCGAAFLQPSTRAASVHVQGLNWVTGGADDGGAVGTNCYSSVYPATNPAIPDFCEASPGNTITYRLFAEHEGPYLLYSRGDDVSNLPSGAGGDGGTLQEGLFGAFHVEPSGFDASGMEDGEQRKKWESGWYRSQVTEQDLCLAQPADRYTYTAPDATYPWGLCVPRFPGELPIVDYQALYPAGHPRAGLPVLDMLCRPELVARGAVCEENELVGGDLTAIVTGPLGPDGQPGAFPELPVGTQPPSLRPVYSYPERLQPYREFTIAYHESYQVNQAFASLYDEFPSLTAAMDNFGINYGMGGIGSVVLANRLRVGSVDECVDCKYEEFFLSSWPLGDPAMVVTVPGSTCFDGEEVDEQCRQQVAATNKALYPDDPSNVYHSYMGDHLKFRILHGGPDLHHLHHQHAHQWLGTPNSPNGDYLDSQSIGPGSAFTLEMVYNGSGNVNQTVGDSIFHCHFYPHFASGMWGLWRVHDVFEAGTTLGRCPDGTYGCPDDRVLPGGGVASARALPDGDIETGTPIPALVPMPTLPMAPLPAPVRLTDDGTRYEVQLDRLAGDDAGEVEWVSPLRPAAEPWSAFRGRFRSPGYPFFIPGIAGSRPPHPPLDFAWACRDSGQICAPTDADLVRYDLPAAAGAAARSAMAERLELGEILGTSDMMLLKGTCDLAADGPCEPMNGGLPRHVSSRTGADDQFGSWTSPPLNNTDFSKFIDVATAYRLPEAGSLVEKIAMATHAERFHPTRLPDGTETGICLDDIQLGPGDVRSSRAPCGEVACSAPGARLCDPGVPGVCCDTSQCTNPDRAVCDLDGEINFVLNGLEPQHGAPFADPCIQFNRAGGAAPGGIQRDYLAVDIQLDAIFDKAGWHFPQQRMISLWGDALDFLERERPPEPLFMRVNSYDCMNYVLANLVPNVYELDDFQVRTPTDILGQHIHLVKFDVTSSDGAANGWNYEDGTFAPNEVTERIEAINAACEGDDCGLIVERPDGSTFREELEPAWIKFFGPGPGAAPGNPLTGQWVGSQATVQRWYNDPLYNNIGVCETDLDVPCTLGEMASLIGLATEGTGCPSNGSCIVSAGFCSDNEARCTEFDLSRCAEPERAECNPSHDRTIRTVFTHDHFGPSTHQQAGLYAGVVPEPKDSVWRNNETGEVMGGYNAATQAPFPGREVTQNGVTVRDSGPTSWQAVIETPFEEASFREFLIQAQDTTLMYQPFGNGAYYPEVWSSEGRSQFRGGELGPCDPDGHEPCGFCSNTGSCSNDPSIACTVDPPIAGTCSNNAARGCWTDGDCTNGGTCRLPPAPAECGDPNATCRLRLGYLTACTPSDRSSCRDPEVESCNFVAGIPSTSWSQRFRSFGSPLVFGGPGGATVKTVEAITFGGGTNNFSFNYRNEPLFPRIIELGNPVIATPPLPGRRGDLGFVYSSFGFCSNDADRLCVDDGPCSAGGGTCVGRPSPRGTVCSNSLDTYCSGDSDCPAGGRCQDAGFCADNYALCTEGNTNLCDERSTTCLDAPASFPYPPLTPGVEPNDPFTPLLRAYAGDDLQVRVLIGAHINPHNLTIHGLNWLKEPSFVDSGWRNSEVMGISEHFESIVKLDPPYAAPDDAAGATRAWTDYLFKPGAAAIEQASGNWGLVRAYEEPQRDLHPLPQNPPPPGGFDEVSICPAGRLGDDGTARCGAPGVRCYEVVATTASQALGGPLVYNPGVCAASSGACIESADALLLFDAGDPDLDCTRSADGPSCEFPRCVSGACSNGGAACSTVYDCWAPEPLVLRANAGDCIQVTLYNQIDAVGTGASSEQLPQQTSNTSTAVGLRPQLVTYDLKTSDGTNVGFNPVQTAPQNGTARYVWYAGHVEPDPEAGEERYVPIEFGAANLLPPDPLNHYAYGLFGGLIVEPAGSTWDAGAGASTTVRLPDGRAFREFVLFMQDGPINDPFVSGGPVEAVNYRANVPSGLFNAYCTEEACTEGQLDDYSCVMSADAFCNVGGTCQPCSTISGWPDTPIFEACAGEEVRFRLLQPGGANTNEVFELAGHTFSEAPYMTEPENCQPPTTHTNLRASQRLGTRNLCASGQFFLADKVEAQAREMAVVESEGMLPAQEPQLTGGVWEASLNEWKASKMGHGPSNHFDVLVAEAGGAGHVAGDYFYRSYSIMHYANGLWGIFRVLPREGDRCLPMSPAAEGLELAVAPASGGSPGVGEPAAEGGRE